MELLKEYHGIDAVVDGLDGKLYLDPEETVLAELVQKKEACGRERAELEKLIGLDNVTRDGRKINVYANIGSPEDVDKVLLNDAGGIGLFRSEFLYLGREDYPSEEEQFEIYKEVLSRMEGKKVNHPYVGYRSRQAGGLLQASKRRKSGDGLSCNPYLFGSD